MSGVFASSKHEAPCGRPSSGGVGLVLRLAGLLGVACLLGGCAVAHYYRPITGRVVDKETGEPIEGAAVVAEYRTASASVGGEVQHAVDGQDTVTDGAGLFRLPGTLVVAPRVPVSWFDYEVRIYVFRSGYGQYLSDSKAERTTVRSRHYEFALRKIEDPREKERLLWFQPAREIRISKIRNYLKQFNNESASLGLPMMPAED